MKILIDIANITWDDLEQINLDLIKEGITDTIYGNLDKCKNRKSISIVFEE